MLLLITSFDFVVYSYRLLTSLKFVSFDAFTCNSYIYQYQYTADFCRIKF